MKNIGYDRQHALRLVPLLRSIVREVCERSITIAQHETHLETVHECQLHRKQRESTALGR